MLQPLPLTVFPLMSSSGSCVGAHSSLHGIHRFLCSTESELELGLFLLYRKLSEQPRVCFFELLISWLAREKPGTRRPPRSLRPAYQCMIMFVPRLFSPLQAPVYPIPCTVCRPKSCAIVAIATCFTILFTDIKSQQAACRVRLQEPSCSQSRATSFISRQQTDLVGQREGERVGGRTRAVGGTDFPAVSPQLPPPEIK